MKNFIYYLSILFFATAIITSCEKDEAITSKKAQHGTDFSQSRVEDRGYEMRGLSHNGRWFVVESEDYVESIVTSLDELVASYESSEGEEEEDGFVDDEPVLAAFEDTYGHDSYRRMLEVDLYNKLEEGYDPVEALNSQTDYEFSLSESSLLNEDRVIQVGEDIYYYHTGEILIKVENEDTERLFAILEGGLLEAYLKPNVRFITTNTFQPIDVEPTVVMMTRDCTAEFTEGEAALNSNDQYTVTFTWAQSANLAAWPGVTLNWDFGDGNTQTVNNNGVVTHTYASHGNYTVSLSVSSPATGQETACETSYTKSISFDEINNMECADYMCLTLNTIGALSPATLGNLLTDGILTTNNELAFVATNAFSGVLDFCTETEMNSVQWTINGTSYTGNSFLFPLTCPDGQELIGTISFGSCSASFSYSTPSTCAHADCIQDWDEQTYNGGNKKIAYKTKTVSRYQDIFFGLFGNNKIQAKMKHFKQKNNGGWKKEKKNLAIDADGTLAYNLSCNCQGDFTVDESASKNNTKTLELERKYNNYSEIHMYGNTYKWFADFKVQGSTIVNNWDASANCN